MYNFRYHLVTIVSIFISLLIGLLLGAAIAGSDLVQGATSEMVRYLQQYFDSLNEENDTLKARITEELALSDELYEAWADKRLDGRTIVILTSNEDAPTTVLNGIRANLEIAGAATIVVTVNIASFGIQNPVTRASLQAVVPPVEGEDYASTIAKRLLSEWTSVYLDLEDPPVIDPDDPDYQEPDYQDPETGEDIQEPLPPKIPSEADLLARYPLTRLLVENNIISINTNYASLLERPALASDQQQTRALQIASSRQLPYAINGLVNTLAFFSDAVTTVDQVGLLFSVELERRGENGRLPYPLWLNNNLDILVGGATAAINSNYYTLLVDVRWTRDVYATAAALNSLSCVTTPTESGGNYSIVALLSGAERGIYGHDRGQGSMFPQAPSDWTGRIPFARKT